MDLPDSASPRFLPKVEAVGWFLMVVLAGVVITPMLVVLLFEAMIVVGLVSQEGPSQSLFLTTLVSGAAVYAGLIGWHTSVKTGVVVFPLVAGLAVGGIWLVVNTTTLRAQPSAAAGLVESEWIAGEPRPLTGWAELIPKNGGNSVRLEFPPSDATPDEFRKTAYRSCAAQSVAPLARLLGTEPTEEAVAREYARLAGRPSVGAACLAAFSSK